MIQIIPVLDVKEGVVVRGIAGRREEYQPIRSQLTSSTSPLEIASAIRDHFGLSEMYLADLDALGGREPALALFESLAQCEFRLWVDAGLQSIDDARRLMESGVSTMIAALETLPGPDILHELAAQWGSKIVFSLDLMNGQPITKGADWHSTALGIADQAYEAGIERMLILDLASVGSYRGPGALGLCREIAQKLPTVRLTTGGGIRNQQDLAELEQAGVESALVASALHDGSITSNSF